MTHINILGLSAFYHDAAAALVRDGQVVAAAQEERFTRKKHDPAFPEHAINYCLREGGLNWNDIDHVVFYEKPFLKFERLLETYVAFAPQGFRSFQRSMPVWIKEKLFQKSLIAKKLRALAPGIDWQKRLLFTEHHHSHAASAFYPSPFTEAVVLLMDGVGEWATTSVFHGRGKELTSLREIHFPHSLGLLYSAFTYYTGFKVNSGEYKLMGLAPYGEPRYTQLILDKLIDLKDDGSFRLNMRYFEYCTGLRMTNARFSALFGAPPRPAGAEVTPFHADIAASIQAVTEECVLRLTKSLAREGLSENLCLAGGVALNCVANGKILKQGDFKNIWIQPAAGDAGGALGAALLGYHGFLDRPRTVPAGLDGMRGSYLGPGYDNSEIKRRLTAAGAVYTDHDDGEIIRETAAALASGKAVGWHQGRMEFGPRALGARSILGDPRSPTMQKVLNLKVKYRESFRPFAPAVRREDVSDWFELDVDSPYMLLVANVVESRRRQMTDAEKQLFGVDKLNILRSEIPAVTHIDYSARVQTVRAEENPRFHSLLTAFKAATACPILVNTSFNVRGEPIVESPEDAFRCFMGTDIEMLVVGNCILRKELQDSSKKMDYKDHFELD